MDVPFGCGSALVLTGPTGPPGLCGPPGPESTGPTGPTGPLAYELVADVFVPTGTPTGTIDVDISTLGFGVYELRLTTLRRHDGGNASVIMQVYTGTSGMGSPLATQSGVHGFATNTTGSTLPVNNNAVDGFILSNVIALDDSVSGVYTLYYLENEPFVVCGIGLLADPALTVNPNPTRSTLTGGTTRTPLTSAEPLATLSFSIMDPLSSLSGHIQLARIAVVP